MSTANFVLAVGCMYFMFDMAIDVARGARRSRLDRVIDAVIVVSFMAIMSGS